MLAISLPKRLWCKSLIPELDFSWSVELSLGDGLVVPPFNWIEVTIPNESVIVNVLASHSYDKDDYLYNRPIS